MRTRPLHTFAAVYLLAALFAVALTGCSSTPTARYAEQRTALTEAENYLTPQIRAGRYDAATLALVNDGIQGWRSALADARRQLPNGGSAFDLDLEVAKSIGRRLAARYLAPATQPDTGGNRP